MWQVPNGRWIELPLDELPPSILIENKRFYIHELAETEDGTLVIPILWIIQNGVTHADCHIVKRNVSF